MLHTSAMAPSTETYSSVKVVTTIESAFDFDTDVICQFQSKDGEHCTECRKVQGRQLLIELFRPEVDTVLVGCGSNSIPQ